MLSRRTILSAAGVVFASPLLAQGKKSTPDSTTFETSTNVMHDIAGRYSSKGLNADGSAYSGECQIQQSGPDVTLFWKIAGSEYTGRGTIEGRVVTVDWGEATPVVYVIMPDGTLHGTWAGGTALEKLSPQ